MIIRFQSASFSEYFVHTYKTPEHEGFPDGLV